MPPNSFSLNCSNSDSCIWEKDGQGQWAKWPQNAIIANYLIIEHAQTDNTFSQNTFKKMAERGTDDLYVKV